MNRKVFLMVLATSVGFKAAWALPKLWALRTAAEPGDGPATKVAQAVLVMS